MPFVLNSSWVGRRVSVRRVVVPGPGGRTMFSDIVGDLLSLGPDVAVVEGRRGRVDVPLAGVAIARLVTPSPADELALAATVAQGWRAEQNAELGGWLLRAAGGFTSRANSALALHAPGVPLEQALGTARAWYAERGLPLRLQIPVRARRLLDAELAERGWPASADVHVLAARLDLLRAVQRTEADAAVDVSAHPDDAWFARYRGGGGASPAARAIVQRHDTVGFASIRRDGAVVAIGRGTVDDGWLGITAVEVADRHRRHGLAQAIMHALWDWGAAHGATRCHLAVSSANAPALALYERLGYWIHHDYRYRDEPAGG
jgi:N-acetylglutamate synthase